jgi:hypothetical protein
MIAMNRPPLPLAVATCVAFAWASSLAAQEPPPGRPHGPPPEGRARPGGDTRPSPGAAPRRDRLWREVVEEMSPAERRAFLALPLEAKERAVREAIAKRSAAEEAAFTGTLSDAERAELDALKDRPELRRRRFVELRVGRHFARAAEEAKARGLIDDAELATLNAAPLVRRAEATLDLQRRTFLAAHREELGHLPSHERERLAKLSPQEFFEQPLVRDFRSFRFLTPPEVMRLRGLGDEEVDALIDGLDRGEPAAEAASRVFSGDRVAALRGLKREDLRRVARDLRRLASAPERPDREPPPDGRGPPPEGREPRDPRDHGPPREGWNLPPRLMEELSPAEAKEVLRLPGVERRAFALRRFGAARVLEARVDDLERRMPPRARERFRKLAKEERERLADLSSRDVKREMERRFPELRDEPPPGQSGPPRPRPPRR